MLIGSVGKKGNGLVIFKKTLFFVDKNKKNC